MSGKSFEQGLSNVTFEISNIEIRISKKYQIENIEFVTLIKWFENSYWHLQIH